MFKHGHVSWLKWPAASLRSYLLAVTLLATIPMTVLAAVLITQEVMASKALLEDQLSRAATSFALTVERETASSIDALYILSLSEPLQEGDLAGIFSALSALPNPRASWRSAFLVSVNSGEVLFNTHQPRGQPLGEFTDMAALARLKATRRAVLTDLTLGPDGQYATGVLVPVFVHGQLTYALGALISPPTWRQLITNAPFSPSGFMTIFDSKMQVIASNQSGDASAPRALPELTRQRVQSHGGTGTGRIGMPGGGLAYGAWRTLSNSGWGVVVGEQARPIDQQRFMSIGAPIALGILSLLAGTSLAMRVARRVTEPLQDLAEHKSAMPGGDASVRELHVLAQALSSAEAQREADRERLQSKADEFETLFQSSPIGLAIAQTRSCGTVLRNPALARMLNEPDAPNADGDMPRTGWPQHIVRSDGVPMPIEEQPLQKAARTGQAQRDVELEVLHSDGRSVRLIAHAVPLFDAQGLPRGAIASFTDITERKFAEDSLANAESQLRKSQHLVDLAQDIGHVGFFNHDFSTGLVAWTSGLATLLGLPQDDHVGPWDAWLQRIDEADRVAVQAHIQQVCAAHIDQSVFEFRAAGETDSDARWMSSRVRILYDEAGQALQMHGVVVDITQQKSMDEERAELVLRETRARMEAENTNRAKDEFLAMLGHELRNPLGAIAAATDVLNHAQVQSNVTQRAREILARQTTHLGRLMDDLLDVARVISGKIALSPRTLRLDELAERVHHGLEASGKTRSHKLTMSLEPIRIHADPARMEQVVTNLLSNALKYTPEQGDIRLTVSRLGEQACLTVQDNGMGMPPELLDKAFDLFVQGERTLDRRQGGLGIGLTLVKRLVELHGGTVSVESEGMQQGCTFRLLMPIPPSNEWSEPAISAEQER